MGPALGRHVHHDGENRVKTRKGAALEALLEAGEVPEYESVKARVVPGEALACPEVHVTMPDLGVYDALLEGEGVVA